MADMYIEGPRHAVVTEDDHGAVLQIVAWFSMVTMILATLLRLAIRFMTVQKPGMDDLMVSLAMVSFSVVVEVLHATDT